MEETDIIIQDKENNNVIFSAKEGGAIISDKSSEAAKEKYDAAKKLAEAVMWLRSFQ